MDPKPLDLEKALRSLELKVRFIQLELELLLTKLRVNKVPITKPLEKTDVKNTSSEIGTN